MAIPRRCCHGYALLPGGSAGDYLFLFGGEGEPPRASDAPSGPAMLNDGWVRVVLDSQWLTLPAEAEAGVDAEAEAW